MEKMRIKEHALRALSESETRNGKKTIHHCDSEHDQQDMETTKYPS